MHLNKRRKAIILPLFGVLVFLLAYVSPNTKPAHASCPYQCTIAEVIAASNTAQGYITQYFTQLQADVQQIVLDEFEAYLNFAGSADGSFLQYFTDSLYENRVKPALENFSKQMSAIGMSQTAIIGMFFDAEQQIKTQRLYQELQVAAHQDYQPSRDFCTFGTNVRSLAASESMAKFNKLALNSRQMQRHLGTKGSTTSQSRSADKASRWNQFTTVYCDVHDNGWDKNKEDKTGLSRFCQTAGAGEDDIKRQNIDIDYTRLIETPRTLDIAFHDETVQPAEQDVLALGNNLFGHSVLTRGLRKINLINPVNARKYMDLRSIAAKRNVAENSFNSIVSMKTNGSNDTGSEDVNTREFLGAILKELGIEDDEIFEIIGENPSYYAQLEILSKKLYQSPDFFAGLYDKPANVLRKSVAMKAIGLMIDRAIYESQTRQEMTMSVLLSTELSDDIKRTGKLLTGTNN